MLNEKGKKRLAFSCGAAGALLLVPFCRWQNNGVTLTRMTVESSRLPASFDGFRILQISDLHNKDFGSEKTLLYRQIRRANPDIIVITGDLIDKRRPGRKAAMDCVREAVKLAPVYYAPGNHEARTAEYLPLREELMQEGVHLLEDRTVTLSRQGESVSLAGVRDPFFGHCAGSGLSEMGQDFFRRLQILRGEAGNSFTLLLSHQPGWLPLYAEAGFDLALSGHVHGGQIRLPLVGGLLGPDRRFFPEYDAGLYRQGETQMVVSRGLGGSLIPQRLFNRPELVLITLQKMR